MDTRRINETLQQYRAGKIGAVRAAFVLLISGMSVGEVLDTV